ncbi:amidohydrolase family protein [Oscillibacter valericigenes]|nr:amidohydrolase family protein [Oscillibacter valericigenes]
MLIIKNGRVLDPLNRVDCVTDVAVEGGSIVRVGSADLPNPGDVVIDATGCIVTPGLIDHHTHLYPLAKIGIPAEAVCFASGVTTAVDAGSTGWATYASKRPFVQLSKLKILAYLNVCTTGLDSLPVLENVDPRCWDEGRIRDCLSQYPDELVGLKLRTSRSIVKELGYAPLRSAVKLAEKLDTHLMVHCTDPPGEFSELLDLLRPGDILTHMYMNQGPALVENGRVIPAALRARERGVLFEAADARMHFGLPVAKAAIREGFYPDIVATDLTQQSMHLRPTSFNLAMQISKYAALGIPVEAVIERCTAAPARQLARLEQIGSLTVGHAADIAIFKPVSQENAFGDRPDGVTGQCLHVGSMLYQPMLTVKNGEMVYRSLLF